MKYYCKKKNRSLFETLICVLKQPTRPSEELVASVSATLLILEDRIMSVDKTILSKHVTDEEFETHYESIFQDFDLSLIEDGIRKQLGERDED